MQKSLQTFLKNENKPMTQATYWIIYLSVGLTYVFKTLEVSAHKSYEIMTVLPEVAQYSQLVKGLF